MFTADMGEMVSDIQIKYMNDFINKHGEEAFKDAVFHNAFEGVAFAYIHPCDEMRNTPNFDVIQKAFINAYV